MNLTDEGKFQEKSWSTAWKSHTFKIKFLIGSVMFTGVLFYYPYFFSSIQQRQGVVLNDYLLSALPSLDMSVYIFTIIYLAVFLGLYRTAQAPYLFLLFLWASLLLSLSRIVTISLVPLEPPAGLVPLSDPVLAPFYGYNQITKDLFYSGHTGSVFLICLILQKKYEKLLTLGATVLVGILLLFQHIHYTIDVVFAPLFVYIIFLLARKITEV